MRVIELLEIVKHVEEVTTLPYSDTEKAAMIRALEAGIMPEIYCTSADLRDMRGALLKRTGALLHAYTLGTDNRGREADREGSTGGNAPRAKGQKAKQAPLSEKPS